MQLVIILRTLKWKPPLAKLKHLGGRLRPGQCIPVESAGNLRCKYVLNTNAPGRSNPDTLRQCYDSAIEKAIEVRCVIRYVDCDFRE